MEIHGLLADWRLARAFSVCTPIRGHDARWTWFGLASVGSRVPMGQSFIFLLIFLYFPIFSPLSVSHASLTLRTFFTIPDSSFHDITSSIVFPFRITMSLFYCFLLWDYNVAPLLFFPYCSFSIVLSLLFFSIVPFPLSHSYCLHSFVLFSFVLLSFVLSRYKASLYVPERQKTQSLHLFLKSTPSLPTLIGQVFHRSSEQVCLWTS
jgi:hypothetical protein